MSGYWSAHTHSRYSVKDALPAVPLVVQRAVELGYPALGLTDHGHMPGTVELYTGCKKAGIKPLPGIEAYVAFDRSHRSLRKDGKPGRIQTHHMCLLATSAAGYRNLVGLNNHAVRNFHFTPVLDLGDFAEFSSRGMLEGVAITTGCWFGLLAKQLRAGSDPTAALNVLKGLERWFGGRVFVEMQNHSIDRQDGEEHDEATHTAVLMGLAAKTGLPVILTQDSHYVAKRDQPVHDLLKELVSWSEEPDDAVFPGDGYHMVDTRWMRMHHEPHVFDAGMAGLAHLEEISDVVIPELDTFKLTVPDTTGTGNADAVLREMVELGLERKMKTGAIKASKLPTYRKRAEAELDVIIPQRFAGYLLFTASVTDFMTEQEIVYNVRGSASGSIVCWLLGITQFDPIGWKLGFERFLSQDFTKPPDIDLDVEHLRRGEVVAWLQSQYHVVNISTWNQLGIKTEDGDTSGSLLVKYKQWRRKKGLDPNTPINHKTMEGMNRLAAHKAFAGYGVHPAGLLVTPDEESAAIIPLQNVASSKTLVTSYDMKSVEKTGLVKLDVLGLKTLTAVRVMSEQTGIGIYDVPLNDKAVLNRIGKGETTGCFQIGEYTARKGVKQLKPRHIHDVIAAMALFRPATMSSGATEDYIRRRHGREPVPARHPIILDRTKDTFGVLLYQEQALGVMQDLGLSVEETEATRKAIKASQEADVAEARLTMAKMVERIRQQGEKHDMSYDDLAWLEQALHSYAEYGFNRAHATAYGVLAYVTAWFRHHHPIQFWGGMLLAYTGHKKGTFDVEAHYAREAKKDGVRILPPHVNISQAGYTIDTQRRAVRRGLTSIKGVGNVCANELVAHAPFETLTELGEKVAARRVTGSKYLEAGHHPMACGGNITALEQAGALRGLTHHNPEE